MLLVAFDLDQISVASITRNMPEHALESQKRVLQVHEHGLLQLEQDRTTGQSRLISALSLA